MKTKYEYKGHKMYTDKTGNKSSFIVYHGKDEKENMIFSHNIIGKDTGKVWFRQVYTPKKIYSTSKGKYVNICGYRFYLNDLIDNYSEIHNLID